MRRVLFLSIFVIIMLLGVFLLNQCSVSPSATVANQLHTDTLLIDKYLLDNNITNYNRNKSGLRYKITSLGTGYKADIRGAILVKYVGKLMSTGAKFDTTYRSKSTRLSLSNLITGWKIAFQLIPGGSKATLYIPSGLAYGTTGSTDGLVSIPANSNLIFDIELMDVIPSPDALQLQKDINTIDSYLASHNINAIKDNLTANGDTGLRYVITTEGTGDKPISQNKIVVQYVGKFLKDGVVFDKTDLSTNPNNTSSFYLNETIRGWQLAFLNFKKGSVVTLYIPSGLAYGRTPVYNTNGSTKIAEDSNLIFEINFVNITS